MVYQDAVLGPLLWERLLRRRWKSYLQTIKTAKEFAVHTPTSEMQAEINGRQEELHKWEEAKQVSFDTAKESKHNLALHGG